MFRYQAWSRRTSRSRGRWCYRVRSGPLLGPLVPVLYARSCMAHKLAKRPPPSFSFAEAIHLIRGSSSGGSLRQAGAPFVVPIRDTLSYGPSSSEPAEGLSSRWHRTEEPAKRCCASSRTRPRPMHLTSTRRRHGRPDARRYCVSKLDRKRRQGLQCRHLRLLEFSSRRLTRCTAKICDGQWTTRC